MEDSLEARRVGDEKRRDKEYKGGRRQENEEAMHQLRARGATKTLRLDSLPQLKREKSEPPPTDRPTDRPGRRVAVGGGEARGKGRGQKRFGRALRGRKNAQRSNEGEMAQEKKGTEAPSEAEKGGGCGGVLRKCKRRWFPRGEIFSQTSELVDSR